MLIHPVPDCHPHVKHTRHGWFHYRLYHSMEGAEDAAGYLLAQQDAERARLYRYGHKGPSPENAKAYNWWPWSDAAVGRRIMDRKADSTGGTL